MLLLPIRIVHPSVQATVVLCSSLCIFCRSKRLKTVKTKPADFYEPRLRLTDVKAGHYERKVQALEKERDAWEEKYEVMSEKHKKVQAELEDFNAQMANI